MDDDGVDPRLLQKRHVAGESLAQRSVAHGVSTIFDHDGLVLVALHEGQGLGEHFGVVGVLKSVGHGAGKLLS